MVHSWLSGGAGVRDMRRVVVFIVGGRGLAAHAMVSGGGAVSLCVTLPCGCKRCDITS